MRAPIGVGESVRVIYIVRDYITLTNIESFGTHGTLGTFYVTILTLFESSLSILFTIHVLIFIINSSLNIFGK